MEVRVPGLGNHIALLVLDLPLCERHVLVHPVEAFELEVHHHEEGGPQAVKCLLLLRLVEGLTQARRDRADDRVDIEHLGVVVAGGLLVAGKERAGDVEVGDVAPVQALHVDQDPRGAADVPLARLLLVEVEHHLEARDVLGKGHHRARAVGRLDLVVEAVEVLGGEGHHRQHLLGRHDVAEREHREAQGRAQHAVHALRQFTLHLRHR
mmetsp:Transcript_26028/g.83002  ORF Transcript_26028/g.83002 Transcript_26028/m.83002 type:complete len:209 (+) Transcript_26028:1934-2560(+)